MKIRKIKIYIKVINLFLGIIIYLSPKVNAAEKILFIYPPLNLSLKVNSLETFARDNTINKELEFYLRTMGLNEEQKISLREALITKYEIDPIHLSRFLNTPTGEQMLEKLGVMASLPGGKNGKYLLRGALVQAALDKEEGLTVLNVLNHLATDIQLNIKEILEFLDYQNRLKLATQTIITEGKTISGEKAAEGKTYDYTKMPDIRQPGQYGVNPVQRIQLYDEKRNRSFYLLVYTPKKWKEGKTPVVVVSHGLASRPEDFSSLGEQLASYGYLVAIPQHRGSDYRQIEDMLTGYSRRLYRVEEFIDRPLDVSYVLDQLDKWNGEKFQNRLQLKNVGVLGHSFGGYTALALAGATWDFENIKLYCDRQIWEANLSMLLQCDLPQLLGRKINFRDERVGAIGVMNPLNSVVFGSEGLSKVKIPVIIGAGTNDPATPAIIEQIRALAWVNSPDKYLFLMVGQAHFLTPSESDSQFSTIMKSIETLSENNTDIFMTYGNTQATAFLQVYIAQEEEYRAYLQPQFWQYVSTQSLPIYWLDNSATEQLVEIYNRFRPADIPELKIQGYR